MVEIKLINYLNNSLNLRHIFYVLIMLMIPVKANSQNVSPLRKDERKIEILNADVWQVNELVDKDLQRLLGM